MDESQFLLDDKFAPITSTIGFIEAHYEDAADAYVEWMRTLNERRGVFVESRSVSGDLEAVLLSLFPLTSRETVRSIFVPTNSRWTAYFDSGWRGTDIGAIRYLAKHLKCHGFGVTAIPHTRRGSGSAQRGRYGAMILSLYGPKRRVLHDDDIRIIQAVNDGGPWEFSTVGKPLPFEDVERYKAWRVKDKFTLEMLTDYCRHLGLEPFDETFYLPPPNNTAILVEKTGNLHPEIKEYTLAEARARF